MAIRISAKNSRAGNTVRNSMAGLVYYLLNLCLNFISRKIFLEYLGTEILGLNTTAVNILQFLNLAELGIGFAVSFSLYGPIAKKDKESINEIITLQGALYKRIAVIIIIGAIVVSCFFPWIFAKMTLPLWYAYASFGVLLFSSLLSYFVNYKQVILTASQQEYKVTFSYKVTLLIKTISQIILIKFMENGYIWWLITEAVFAILASWILNIVIRRNHPYLKDSNKKFRELRGKYPVLVKKVKQLFVHRIASFAVTQTSPLIIYAFLSLTMVAYYGNYMMVISGATLLVYAIFNGLSASVGNLIAEGNKQRILEVFNELFCFRFTITTSVCICFFFISDSFISVWIGEKYVLEDLTVALFTIYMFLGISRGVVDTFINGYGLFKDIWAPITEATLNIGGSILGGYLFGLNGIIGGTILSQIIIIFFWKPYFLFSEGIKTSIRSYIVLYAKCLAIAFIAVIVITPVISLIYDFSHSSFMNCLLSGFFLLCLSVTIISVGLYFTESAARRFLYRLISMFKR